MNIKKIITLITICVFLLTINTYATPENTMSDVQLQYQLSEEYNNQYDKLLASWNNEFPNYYAGAYIKNNKLNILVTCNPSTVHKEMEKITGNKDIIIKKADYTYEYLESINEKLKKDIVDLIKPDNEIAKSLVGFGIDEINNSVYIQVLKNKNIKKNEVYDILNYEDEDAINIKFVNQRQKNTLILKQVMP